MKNPKLKGGEEEALNLIINGLKKWSEEAWKRNWVKKWTRKKDGWVDETEVEASLQSYIKLDKIMSLLKRSEAGGGEEAFIEFVKFLMRTYPKHWKEHLIESLKKVNSLADVSAE